MANLQTRITAYYKNMAAWKGVPNSDVVSDLTAFFEINPYPQDVRQTYLIKQCVYIALGCLKTRSLDNLVADLAVNYCWEYLRRTEPYDDPHCQKTRAVFNAAAGDFLRYLAKNTPHADVRVDRLREAYAFFDSSVNISRSLNDNIYLGYQLANRADIAFYLSESDSDGKKWLLLAAQDKAESAEILESMHPVHAAHQRVFAAADKFQLSKLSAGVEQRKLVLEAINHGIKALAIMPEDYILCCSLGDYHENLFVLTGEKSHYVDACNFFKRALRNPDGLKRLSARRKLKELRKLYRLED